MTKIFRLITPSNCTSLEHLTTLKKQGGLSTPLLDMMWWNVATAVSAYRNPNRHNPTNKDGTSPIWEIALLNKHIPAHMSTPTDIYRSIMQERPTKPLHHKLHTAMNTPPTETNWLNLVKNLNTPGIPPSIRNQALQVATNMKPLNNRRPIFAMWPQLAAMDILNVIPNSPDSAKTAAKTLVGLYNFHTSTLPQELARVEPSSTRDTSNMTHLEQKHQHHQPPSTPSVVPSIKRASLVSATSIAKFLVSGMIYRAECARYHDAIQLVDVSLVHCSGITAQPSRTISFSPLVTVQVTMCFFAFPISAASAFAILFKVDNQVPNLLRNACLLALASELQVLAEPVQPPDSLPELSFTLSTISPLVTILSTVMTFDVTISRMRCVR
ncbi:hypothetical protein Pelo_9065 [Pelomyxa schiedti]|nr:hypothetical protein Pelo_9065 [Pelomyxa schiedti]